MKNPFDPVTRWYDRAVERARSRSPRFDHFWRAKERYGTAMGGRLAAAIAYYAYFAAFALAVLAYSILGYALGNSSELKGSVAEYLTMHLPQVQVEQIQGPRGTFAAIGLIGLALTGVGWVEGLRSSQRLIWGLEEQPGNLIIRRLVDLGILVGLGLLLAFSLWIVGGIERLIGMAWIGMILGWLVNLLLAAALLAAVPRLRMAPRRLLPPALLVAFGVSLLTTVGQVIVRRTEHNPAYQFASSVVGLLLFLYLFSQLLLFGAAIAATSRYGRVVDLAAGPPAPRPPEPAADPAAHPGVRPPKDPGGGASKPD